MYFAKLVKIAKLNLLHQLYIFSVNYFKIINVNKRCLQENILKERSI